jgi:hypothetical protein
MQHSHSRDMAYRLTICTHSNSTATMSRPIVLTVLLALLVLSGAAALGSNDEPSPKKARPAMPGSDSGFWLEPDTRRMCIKQRDEWDGLLLRSSYGQLFAMTVADA